MKAISSKIADETINQSDKSYLKRIYAGLFGVGIGFYAALIVSILFPFLGNGSQDQILDWTKHVITPEPIEKTLYFLSLVFGGLGAAVTCKMQSGTSLKTKIIFLCLLALLANYIAKFSLKNETILFSVGGLLLTIGIYIYEYKKQNKNQNINNKIDSIIPERKIYFNKIGLISGAFLLFFLFIPYSFEHVAAVIGPEMHVASYIFGPALYAKANLIPGVDFYNQYSLGYGQIFKNFLGTSFHDALTNYVKGITVYSYLFALQLFAFLTWLYRSWILGIFGSILISCMLFHTEKNFFDPSSFCLRYPFYIIVITSYLYYLQKNNLLSLIVLGATLAAGIFLSPETGLYQTLGILFVEFCRKSLFKPKLIRLFKISLMAAIFFLLITIVFYRDGMINKKFWIGLAEPLILFGSINFGACSLRWTNIWMGTYGEYHIIYNIICPAICIAVCGQAIHGINEQEKRGLAVLYFASTGLLLLTKYINMSIIVLWLVNSIGVLTATIFIIQKINFQFKNKFCEVVCLLIIFAGFTLFCNDSRNLSLYGLNSWAKYPSIPKKLLGQIKSREQINLNQFVNQKDLEFVKAEFKSGSALPLLSLYDYVFLIENQSTPVFAFIPSSVMFTKNQILISVEKLKKYKTIILPLGIQIDQIASYKSLMEKLKRNSINLVLKKEATSIGLYEISQDIK